MTGPFIQDIAVETVDPRPSLYVLFAEEGETRKGLLKISDAGDTGEFVWSTYMGGLPWEVSVDGETAYVAGYFSAQQADLDDGAADNPLLTSPGSRIAWYDKNGNWLTDPALDTPTFTPALTQLLPGLNQFSAVATDAEGRIGMAGVVVTVLAPTKFYVVDDATANQTFEYSAGSAFNESYSLNTGNTAPRGAASTATGDKTWVVDANRKV